MKILLVPLMLMALIPFVLDFAYAQTSYVINIPTGAASPDAPYFWQSEKDGDTSGDIQIKVLDSVRWENADTAAHTVTSGTAADGPDGLFDSSLFPPGSDFSYQFTEIGKYDYFCIVHPWMTGVVTVQSGLQVIPKIGSSVGDGKTTFDVEYQFNRVISSASVNEAQKSITFEIVGVPKGEDNTLTLYLPKNLISGPYVVWAGNQQISDVKTTDGGDMNEVMIPLQRDTQRITIVGTSVVPEFGAIALAILAIGITSFIVMSYKSPRFLMLHGKI